VFSIGLDILTKWDHRQVRRNELLSKLLGDAGVCVSALRPVSGSRRFGSVTMTTVRLVTSGEDVLLAARRTVTTGRCCDAAATRQNATLSRA
jgi:hypothetical protein